MRAGVAAGGGADRGAVAGGLVVELVVEFDFDCLRTSAADRRGTVTTVFPTT